MHTISNARRLPGACALCFSMGCSGSRTARPRSKKFSGSRPEVCHMPVFNYRAVDARGIAQAGEIHGSSRSTVLDLLGRRGLVPVHVEEARHAQASAPPGAGRRSLRLRGPRLDSKDLVAITESLAALLQAGLTIDRGLTITAQIKKQKRIGPVLVELGRAV